MKSIKEITEEFGKRVCAVSLTATVEKIPQKIDPSYSVVANVLPSIILRDGEEAKIQIKFTKPSFIYLLLFTFFSFTCFVYH